MRNFRKDRSFLAFTNRDYDDFFIAEGIGSGHGFMNNLQVRGWEPNSIVDEETFYQVKLTGTGQSDVTIRNIQKLRHAPGTRYEVFINDNPRASFEADEFGLVTIPQVRDDALIRIVIEGTASQRLQDSRSSVPFQVFDNRKDALVFKVDYRGKIASKLQIRNLNGRLVVDLSAQVAGGIAVWSTAQVAAGVYIASAYVDRQWYGHMVTVDR
jgi:hypothetical protein